MTKSYLFFCFNLLILISPSQSRFLTHRCDDGNYTANSPYQTNLDSIVSSLASAITATPSGFLHQSAGQPPDKVNALALCRGDVQLDNCSRCINDSYDRAREYCPNRQGATVWFDDCMLRYSSGTIFDVLDTRGGAIWIVNDIPNAEELYGAMRPLMERLKDEASRGDRLRRKFAYGDTLGPRFSRIYGLMQCTPDLSEDECYRCLETAANWIPSCCSNSSDVRVLYPSCNVRYLNSRFYNDTVVLAPPPTEVVRPPPMSPPPSPTSKSSNTTFIIIAVISTVSFVTLIAVFTCVVKKRKRKLELRPTQNFDHEHGNIDEISTAKSLHYSFGVIRAATDNFSHNNKLGEGGFGVVYKGKLQNGKEIAVKRLSKDSGQGQEEFKNEVVLLARLQHKNLVRLLGYSLKGSERLLMYEFIQNASLDKFIFHSSKRLILDWERRYKIIMGVARGLLYLHEDSRLKIIHRDLKASNILLDAQMIPKIADFGMARLFTPEETQANTCRIVGTYGYMAPEYALHGEFSVKSDVFSFGVLLLEIVTGHNNHSFQNGVVVEDLISHAWKCWRNGTTSRLIDPTLTKGLDYVRKMTRCIQIGLLCVQEEASDRPTMGSVVLMLSSSSLALAAPSEPAFFNDSSMNPETPVSNLRTRNSNHLESISRSS